MPLYCVLINALMLIKDNHWNNILAAERMWAEKRTHSKQSRVHIEVEQRIAYFKWCCVTPLNSPSIWNGILCSSSRKYQKRNWQSQFKWYGIAHQTQDLLSNEIVSLAFLHSMGAGRWETIVVIQFHLREKDVVRMRLRKHFYAFSLTHSLFQCVWLSASHSSSQLTCTNGINKMINVVRVCIPMAAAAAALLLHAHAFQLASLFGTHSCSDFTFQHSSVSIFRVLYFYVCARPTARPHLCAFGSYLMP